MNWLQIQYVQNLHILPIMAKIIFTHADHTKEHMGLTTWKNSPDGRILKSDSKIAKNYLSEGEIRKLERTVTGYFDYIEDLIENENSFDMKQFASSVNEFLSFRKYKILPNKGITRAQADAKAESEYEIFNKTQQINSDFDKDIKGFWIRDRCVYCRPNILE